MKFMYFVNCNSLQEVKSMYRDKVKLYHPDKNPNVDIKIIQQLNAEYNFIQNKEVKYPIRNGTNYTNSQGKQRYRENKRKYTKKQEIDIEEYIINTFNLINERGYKKYFLYYKFIEYMKDNNFEVLLQHFKIIAKLLEYKEYWAEIKYKEYQNN